jgi:hypothetical protein
VATVERNGAYGSVVVITSVASSERSTLSIFCHPSVLSASNSRSRESSQAAMKSSPENGSPLWKRTSRRRAKV